MIYVQVLKAQADLGLDVVTDGEMERGAYYMQVEYNQEKQVLCKKHSSSMPYSKYSGDVEHRGDWHGRAGGEADAVWSLLHLGACCQKQGDYSLSLISPMF